jgi:hypothetical protein
VYYASAGFAQMWKTQQNTQALAVVARRNKRA